MPREYGQDKVQWADFTDLLHPVGLVTRRRGCQRPSCEHSQPPFLAPSRLPSWPCPSQVPSQPASRHRRQTAKPAPQCRTRWTELIATAQAIPVRPAPSRPRLWRGRRRPGTTPAAPPQSTPASQRPGLPGIASRYSCGAPSLARAWYIAPARAEANPRARYSSGASQLRLPCGGPAFSSCASVCHPPAGQSINCWALPPCPAATGLPASW